MTDQSPLTTIESDDAAPSSKRRRRWFILFAIAMGLLPVLLLELGLRVARVGEKVSFDDPLVGFSRVSPLFEREDADGVYRTSRSRRVLFETAEFAINKPADGFRIFCLGGSTVRGRPYTNATAFPRWLELELAARDPRHTYEVVNCGGLSYASYRLRHLLEEVLTYEPDLIIIATGHNEFLEDRTYADIKDRSSARAWVEDRLLQLRIVRVVRDWVDGDGAENTSATLTTDGRTVLPELVDARLDQASGYASYHRDADWRADVEEHFDLSLRAMIAQCNSENVPCALVLLGSNVRDCPPFKSEHRDELSVDEEREWQRLFDRAERLQDTDSAAALDAYREALVIDDEYAQLHFRMARWLEQLDKSKSVEAHKHYLAAREHDICPLRMLESFAERIRKLAADTQTPVVNAREVIQDHSDDHRRLPVGYDWYMDHVHPSIGAHQLIAAELVETLDRTMTQTPEQAAFHTGTKFLPSLDHWSLAERRAALTAHLESLGPNYLIEGAERVSWVENWARRQRRQEETLPTDPLAHLRYGHRLWDFGHRDDALVEYTKALDFAQSFLGRALRLHHQGRTSEAIELLDFFERQQTRVPDEFIDGYRQLILE